jgi:hypothetical protein
MYCMETTHHKTTKKQRHNKAFLCQDTHSVPMKKIFLKILWNNICQHCAIAHQKQSLRHNNINGGHIRQQRS